MRIDLKKNVDVRYAIGLVVLFVISIASLAFWYFIVDSGKWTSCVGVLNQYRHDYKVGQCYQKYNFTYVEQQLDQYRSCENLTDCIQIQGTMCGYQRGTLVNKQYVNEAQQLISACEATPCSEDGPMVWPVCENHRCIYKIAQPGEPPPIPLY